ncbi:MAG: methyltransferase [Deltaproteobacteria bacterium]|nr:methyltransferase [Deltaproteobacteria bacterium]
MIGPSPISVPRLLQRVGSLVRDTRDIVEERVSDDSIPSWAKARGWTTYLLSLGDDDVHRCEGQGLASRIERMAGAPQSLIELAREVHQILDEVPMREASASLLSVRRASPRKLSQLALLIDAAGPLIERSMRVVDVGSGRGSLSISLGSRFAKPVIGVELVEDRVRGAAKRALQGDVTFVHCDAVARGLGLQDRDLAMGLHACGELGDTLIREAIEAHADVALVTCCVQKVRGEARAPISRAGADEGLSLRRDVLGLANLSAREQGVETPIEQTMRAREARCALRLYLRERGIAVCAGDEMRGLNRRQAQRGPRELIAAALAKRGMAPATEPQLDEVIQRARDVFGKVRRLTLPRAMLGPVVELAVVLDRASALVEAGYAVQVLRLFAPEASPRNLVILAQGP